MSNVYGLKAVYYRTTTDGKTKWVKIEDVFYTEFREEVYMYDYKQITRPGADVSPQRFVRDQ
jgi:hypothetical protein